MTSTHSNPFIRKLHNLFPLSAEEERALENAPSRSIEYGADEDIVLEGDSPTDCNLLLEGFVCRYKLLPDGKRQIMSFHCAGDIFDAQSFILDVMDHSVCTLTRCKVALIPHRVMLEITEAYPRIARTLWKETLIDAAVFRAWLTNVGRRNAYGRIAHLFCEQYTRMNAVGLSEDHRIPWPITQAEIGDALGLSFVHVNRTLMELRAAGLLTLKDSMLIIHDWKGLQEAAQFDPTYLHLRTPEERARASNGGSGFLQD